MRIVLAFALALCLAGNAQAQSSHVEDLIPHYAKWWLATDAEKNRCVQKIRELTANRQFAVNSVIGSEVDADLRAARCLDIYSHLFGGDALPAGSGIMDSSSVEAMDEYLFVYINSFIRYGNGPTQIDALVKRIAELKPEQIAAVKTVVIDVQGNAGGNIDELHKALNAIFSPRAGLEYLKPSNGMATYGTSFKTDRVGTFAGRNIRILANGGTSSSAEWMIETLCYEWYPDKCVSVGSKTFGKAILQCLETFKYPDQSFTVKLTCGEWYLDRGRKSQERVAPEKVQGVGIEPDKPMAFLCERFAYGCIAKELAQAGL